MTHTLLAHTPVMLNEVLDLANKIACQSVVDGTLGLGGHAHALLKNNEKVQSYWANDLDDGNRAQAEKNLAQFSSRIHFVKGNFSELPNKISRKDCPPPRLVLLDLGLCSTHLDQAERGFAFAAEGPLHMNFDLNSSETAQELLNTASVDELRAIFREWGEEPSANKLAQKIVTERESAPLNTTKDLCALIDSVIIPPRRKKTYQRVFQALRIAINSEMEHLQSALEGFSTALDESNDTIAVITYHSLEDRLVKQKFREMMSPSTQATEHDLHAVVAEAEWDGAKKPLVPTDQEIQENPRARSAKLRFVTRK